jgi:hypothetical protein
MVHHIPLSLPPASAATRVLSKAAAMLMCCQAIHSSEHQGRRREKERGRRAVRPPPVVLLAVQGHGYCWSARMGKVGHAEQPNPCTHISCWCNDVDTEQLVAEAVFEVICSTDHPGYSGSGTPSEKWMLPVGPAGKRVPLQEFPLHRRGAMGVFAIKFTGRSGGTSSTQILSLSVTRSTALASPSTCTHPLHPPWDEQNRWSNLGST